VYSNNLRIFFFNYASFVVVILKTGMLHGSWIFFVFPLLKMFFQCLVKKEY